MTYWRDSLIVGVSKIDEQHRKLVGAIDQLMEACMQGKGRAVIDETLTFTVSYTTVHFRDEEELQAKYAYPGMVAHKMLHAKFIKDISELLRELERDGPSVALTSKISKALVDWLIKHISTEDKKLGEHISKHGG